MFSGQYTKNAFAAEPWQRIFYYCYYYYYYYYYNYYNYYVYLVTLHGSLEEKRIVVYKEPRRRAWWLKMSCPN